MGAAKIQWTDAMRAEIVRLYKIEGKSSKEIAQIMGGGMTKNMVLGQLFHMGEMRSGKAVNGVSPRQRGKRKSTYQKREKVAPMIVNDVWSMEEDARRKAFMSRAAKGARALLMEMENGQA